jgi:predicted enzyme involved in methoxymalonyl-ACP biosynthesis
VLWVLEGLGFFDDSYYKLGLASSMFLEITVIEPHVNDDSWIDSVDSLFDLNVSIIARTKQYRQQKEREIEYVRCDSVEEYNLNGIYSQSRSC